jgi:hypothetical protein
MKCVNWDLGQFEIRAASESRYGTLPMVNDIIAAPKRWGGNHALVVLSTNLVGERYQIYTIYLGEYINGKVQPRRTGPRYSHI